MAAAKKSADKYYFLLAGLLAIYAWLSLAIPPDPQSLAKYHLSVSQSHLLSLLFVPIVGLLWFTLFYGFIKVKNYAYRVARSKEGRGYNILANGLGVFAVSSTLNSLITQILTFYSRSDAARVPLAVNVTNYVTVAVYLASFGLIYWGAKTLGTSVSKHKPDPMGAKAVIYWILGMGYGYLLLTKAEKNTPPRGLTHAAYYLSDPVIAITIIFPYLVAWYFGLAAAYYLSFFAKNVEGLIYQQALRRLSVGVRTVVATSIVLELFTLFGSKFGNLNLGPILAIVFVLIAVIAIGYVLLATGARKLDKIEEVV